MDISSNKLVKLHTKKSGSAYERKNSREKWNFF